MILEKKILSAIIVVIVISTIIPGCIEQNTNYGSSIITIPAYNANFSENPKLKMASYYSLDELVINSTVAQYNLPLDLDTTENYQGINYLLTNNNQISLLEKNGFVVVDWSDEDDIIQPYKDLKDRDIPIFVTSDTLLHLYHVQFDEILKGIEEREFFDKILDLGKVLFDKSKEDYATFEDDILKEAAKRNIEYFGVGLTLLQSPTEDYDGSESIKEVDFEVPAYAKENIENEIDLIETHEGFSESSIFNYMEDYSQYVPRGHYTRSEKLKRYFKAMMWYGRISFLMKGGEPNCQSCEYIISSEDAKIQTIQASLISTRLASLESNEELLKDIWDRIYVITTFFVGAADDLTPYEYLESVEKIFGLEFNATEFADDAKLLDLKVELATLRCPKIYGGTGNIAVLPPVTEETLYEVLEKTKGMRLMGQRFIPDSYMFQHLTTTTGDYIGDENPFTMCITGAGRPARCFPRGLDIMAILGSNRAFEILVKEGDTKYEGVNQSYNQSLDSLKEEFSNVNTTEWNQNLYWSWLFTLKSILKEYNDSYPTFMQTEAWLDKELNTALSSWSELRHDTILYAKQSYTMVETGMPLPPKETKGYVEPVPEFYSRLLGLTRMTNDGLTDMNALNETEKSRLSSLEYILERLINISKDELENKILTDDDYKFIRNFGENLEGLIEGVSEKGQKTTIVADVHTDANTQQALEEGVGYVDLMLVAYKLPTGEIYIGAGPVMSHYEFKQDMSNRLTDEGWQEMLEGGNEPERAPWTISFISE